MTEPAWRRLHEDWWIDQREPRPGDVELAWEVLWEVVPTGWTVARPQRDLVTRQWNVSAVLVSGTSRIGHMPKVVSAQGPTEPAVLVELARCLSEVEQGRVPR